jgi:aspartyl-tRNA(Asn)/glutamyl-tRNA(Gln) amidotransferase subunit A
VIAYASSFDQIGVLEMDWRYSLIAELISGPDEFDSTVEHAEVPSYSTELTTQTGTLEDRLFQAGF